MPEFIGICPFGNNCRAIWNNVFLQDYGIYPATLLPTNRTTWHADITGEYPLGDPLLIPGDIGLPTGGLFGVGGQGFAGFVPGTSGVHTPITEMAIIFAKTAYRVNVAHVLTQEEIDSVNEEDGFQEIDVGEYVYEVVAVTDNPLSETILTDQEKDEVEADPDRTIEDAEFIKLIELDFPNNVYGANEATRFEQVIPNREGVFYRLDNGDEKANLAFPDPDFFSGGQISFKDGSSTKISVDLKKIIAKDLSTGTPDGPFDNKPLAEEDNVSEEGDTLQAVAREPEEGDVIYLTYIAVKEHYVRQLVKINWLVQAGGILSCASSVSRLRVANYRFYDWLLEPEENKPAPRLSGWRAVESFNAAVNMVTGLGTVGTTPIIGDIPIGGSTTGAQTRVLKYLPGNATLSDVKKYARDDSELPTYSITLDSQVGNGSRYHRNSGVEESPNAYFNADWYIRNLYTKYLHDTDAYEHTFFNVHPKALRKRDVDKWSINRFLATEVESDVKSGKISLFPFMDDPEVDIPTDSSGANEFLSRSNMIFQPFLPLRRYGPANATTSCGVFNRIAAQFAFGGELIQERFDKDTKVLVERFSHSGASGSPNRLILLEGVAAPEAQTISCISDPSYNYSFATHVGSSGFVVMDTFKNSYIKEGMTKLSYRPDLGSPPVVDNTDPRPAQFESLLGYTGLLGDLPGYKEGRIISTSYFTSEGNVIKKVSTSEESAEDDPTTQPLTYEMADKLTINVGDGFYGNITITYRYIGELTPFDILVILRDGADIDDIIDSITLNPLSTDKLNGVSINHQWQKGDTIEIVGARFTEEFIDIDNIEVTGLKEDIAVDFLGEDPNVSPVTESPVNVNKFSENIYLNNGVFFASDVVSISESSNSILYVFFNDADTGISVAVSNDFGSSWYYYYGIIEPINGEACKDPFAVTNFDSDSCFIFFKHLNKLLCKKILFKQFSFKDAFIVERFEKDILEPGGEGDPPDPLPTEKVSKYSVDGVAVRRRNISWYITGDMTDEKFLTLLGKEEGSTEFVLFEDRILESSGLTSRVRKYPIGKGSTTASVNYDILDIFFSAYQKDNGELRVFFLAPTGTDSEIQLQCHFSTNDGVDWYDLWEYKEFEFGRLRFDPETQNNFIDLQATSSPADAETILNGSDPQESEQNAPFGINVHWSRLKRDKKAGTTTEETESLDVDSESETLEVSAPYVFYQPTTEAVFLFYVYQSCLLCKIINDNTFDAPIGMDGIKRIIERDTRAYFIDGNLDSEDLRVEIQDYANPSTQEVMIGGNIVFPHQYAIDTFDENRSIHDQRVCAYELPNGNVRVMYKHQTNGEMRGAVWTGSSWHVEDLLRNPVTADDLVGTCFGLGCSASEACIEGDCVSVNSVTGGFGEDAFGAESNGNGE